MYAVVAGSKVRSLMMDTLEPEQRNVLLRLGNAKVAYDSPRSSPSPLTPNLTLCLR